MCLVKTAFCFDCGKLQIWRSEQGCWRERECDNPACLRKTRSGATFQLKSPDPCSSFCDSEHCGHVFPPRYITYIHCLHWQCRRNPLFASNRSSPPLSWFN